MNSFFMNRSSRLGSKTQPDQPRSFFSRLSSARSPPQRTAYSTNYSTTRNTFPQTQRSSKHLDSTIGIKFHLAPIKLSVHQGSRLHSIKYSDELYDNPKSLKKMRCQDYLLMIGNKGNCLENLENEVNNAIRHNHLNKDLLNGGSSQGGLAGNNEFSFFSKNGGQGGRSTPSFFQNRGGSNNLGSGNSFFGRNGIFLEFFYFFLSFFIDFFKW